MTQKNSKMFEMIVLLAVLFFCCRGLSISSAWADCTGGVSEADHARNGHYQDGTDGPYVDNGDNTVTDQGTGLMWQQRDDGEYYDWEDACNYCDELALAGYDDWELPGIYQLESLIDENYTPAINTAFFPETKIFYWSGSRCPDYYSDVWGVDFNLDVQHRGTSYCGVDTDAYSVRCVRFAVSDPDPEPLDINYPEGFLVLTDDTEHILESKRVTHVYGCAGTNRLVLESGGFAKLFNMPGSNIINIDSTSGLFTVFRSGATITLAGSDNTMLSMPATATTQSIFFTDTPTGLDLLVSSGKVMLGSLEVGITPVAVFISTQDSAIVIDHTCTDISQIPETWINQAKSSLRLSYGHTSHGSQPITGMEVLMSQNALYAFNTDGSVSSGTLSIADGVPDGDLGWEGDTAWADCTRDYLDASGSDRNVVIWSWCGGVSYNTQAGINTYLSTMNQIESEYPDVTFVYMTGHLDGTGQTGNLNVRNEQIRDYCRNNNKVLFDFADIESYDPDGNDFMVQGATDECYYNGESGHWAAEWCATHPGDVLCTSCGYDDCCAHSHPLNCNLKARAFWWMLARIGGWQP